MDQGGGGGLGVGCENKTGVTGDTKVGGRMALPLPEKEKIMRQAW